MSRAEGIPVVHGGEDVNDALSRCSTRATPQTGQADPRQVLKLYREKTGINATVNATLDANVPTLLADFSRGDL